MTELSPAAQAVLDAFNREARPEPHHQREAIAAALCAATDQAVPEEVEPDHEEWVGQSTWFQANYQARFKLLAIAAELAGTQPSSGGD